MRAARVGDLAALPEHDGSEEGPGTVTAMQREQGTRPRVILPGGNGFIGRFLGKYLVSIGFDVVVLSRSPVASTGNIHQVRWDARTLGDWVSELDGARAIVNLVGRSVNCRYNERNRREILESRVDSTRVLGKAIAQCANPPPVWLNQSTATIYRHSFDRGMDEATGEIRATPEIKDAFSLEVAREWERALEEATTPTTRKVALRTAIVFGPGEGGIFRVFRGLARWGLGGAVSGGNQVVSWIHDEDFCRVVSFLIDREDFRGPVNVASPTPTTQRELMSIIRGECGRSIGLPATRGLVTVAAFIHRTEPELILKSRWVAPARLLAARFEFHVPTMDRAVRDLESRYQASLSARAA